MSMSPKGSRLALGHGLIIVSCVNALAACSAVRPSAGGGQLPSVTIQRIQTDDVALPKGYRIERW